MPKQLLLFLSHSGVDTENARELKRRIESSPSAGRLGLKVWFDKDDLEAGKSWQRQLEQVIQKRCTAFAVYVGSKGVMNWVEGEVSLGLRRATADRSFPFIPILAQKSTASALPPFAALYHAVRDPLNDPAEMEKLLAAVLGPGEPVALLDEPFVGLRAMTESEADRFFGRTAEVGELVGKLEKSRLVAVVADSGSGKSSLVLAGLIPKFRGGAFADPARQEPVGRIWHVVTVRPGSVPFDNLRKAVVTAAERLALSPREKAELGELIEPSKPQQTAYALQGNLPAETTETLLVIDQFEELFTQTPENLRAPFIDWVLSLIGPAAVLGFRVVLIIRSDYFNLCSTHPVLFDLLRQDDVNFRLKQITAEGQAAIVREPLRMAGHSDQDEQDALISQIKRDVSDRPGDLALIQMALFETWKQHKLDGSSLLESYAKVGGISGALAHAAEEVRIKKLDPKQQELLEPVFVRVINLGDTGGATRRVARIDEFDGSRGDLIKMLSEERCSRLLLLGAETVDICHEQLITQWPWLQSRITERAVDARRLGRLMEKGKDWNSRKGRDKDQYLATGADLEVFENLARQHAYWLSPSETRYVKASKDAREREERRGTWWFRGVAAASFLFAIAAIIAGFFYQSARKQEQIANDQTQIAENQAKIAVNRGDQIAQQLNRANRALARGIWSDLVFGGKDLTPRELDALWLLCSSDKAIRDRFVEELVTVPDNLLRFGTLPYVVERALGLDWPLPAEARGTLDAVLQAMQRTTDARALQHLAQAMQALPGKLTHAQAQQALDTILQQIQRTTDANAFEGLAHAVQALAGKLTDASQAQQALNAVLQAMQRTTNFIALAGLAQAAQAVAAPLTDVQPQQVLDAVLQAMRAPTGPGALQGLAQAVAGKLTDAHAQQAFDTVLQAMAETVDEIALSYLGEALAAVAAKLTDAQAQEALDSVLQVMRGTTDAQRLLGLARAARALRAELTDAQAQQALDAVLQVMRGAMRGVSSPGALSNVFLLLTLTQAVKEVAAKLTDAQARQALDALLQAMQGTTNADELDGLAEAVQPVAARLTDAQAQQAIDALLQSIHGATSPGALRGPVQAIRVVAGKLTDAQAQQALDAVVQAIRGTSDAKAVLGLAQAVQALPGKLTHAQAQEVLDAVGTTSLAQAVQAVGGKLTDAPQAQGALDAVLQAMQKTTKAYTLADLARAVQALPGKLTHAQAQQALDSVLQAMLRTSDLGAAKGLAQALQALAGKLTDASQAQQALDAVLHVMQRTTDANTLEGLAQAVQAVAAELTDTQAQQAFEAVLQAMRETTDANAVLGLAQAAQAVAGKLTETQAQQVFDAVLEAVRGTIGAATHLGLARAAQALAGKLTDARAEQVLATGHLKSAFGWSMTSEESAAWAEVITTLLRRPEEPDYVDTIVKLLKYPIAAGPATTVLLEALRVAAAPGAEAGLPANLRWLVDTYPTIDLKSAPACPTPLSSGLACPSET